MSAVLAAFRPPPTWPALALIRRDEIPASAWHGQLRDGALRVIWGDAAVTAGVRITPELRVQAVAGLVPDRAVIGRLTALWVYTGRHAPERVEILVRRKTRPAPPNPQRTCAEADLPDADIARVAGVRLTTVQRTGTDLARWLPTHAAVPLVADLVDLGFDPDLARRDVRRLAGQRHIRTAQRTLALVGR